MYRNWLIISLLVLLGLSATVQFNPWGPPSAPPVALDGGSSGDGGDDDDDPLGPGL